MHRRRALKRRIYLTAANTLLRCGLTRAAPQLINPGTHKLHLQLICSFPCEYDIVWKLTLLQYNGSTKSVFFFIQSLHTSLCSKTHTMLTFFMLECSVIEKPCFLVHASSCCRQHCGRRKQIFLSPSFTDQFRLPHLSYFWRVFQAQPPSKYCIGTPHKKSRNATRQGSSAGSANLPHPSFASDTFPHLPLENMMLWRLSDSKVLSQDKEFIQK